MTAYWLVNFILWGAVTLYALPGAWSAVRSRSPRRGDPMRLACFLVGVLFTGHIARWLVSPNNGTFWKALYVVGGLTALYVLQLMRAYGRGARVNGGDRG